MDEKRNQTFKVLFEQLDTAISNSAETFELEYAFLGLVNNECYDVRKKIIRTSELKEFAQNVICLLNH